MSTIDDAVNQLKINDTIRVKWKPFIRIYGRDTFICNYLSCDKERKEITVKRELLDLFDIKCIAQRTMPYDKIESIELLEPKKLY